MNCNCNTHNNGGDAATTATPKNKIRRGNPYYINLAVTLNGEPATEEQVRDISIYLVDERGNKTHLYDTTQSDNTISARVEGMERLGRYSAEIVYHPSGRKERVQDIKDVVEIVATSDEESINGQPISTEILGINLTADMVVSLSASASTNSTDVDTKIDALRNEMLTEIWSIASNPRPTTPETTQTKLRVDNGYLQVSYNDGYSWVDVNLSDVRVGVSHDGQYTASTIGNLVYNVLYNPQLSALHDKVTAIEGKSNQATAEVTYQGEKVPITFLAEELERTASELEYITTGLNTEVATKTDLSALEDKVTEIEGKYVSRANYTRLLSQVQELESRPIPQQTYVQVGSNGMLQVSYDEGNSWTDISFDGVMVDNIELGSIRNMFAQLTSRIDYLTAEVNKLKA